LKATTLKNKRRGDDHVPQSAAFKNQPAAFKITISWGDGSSSSGSVTHNSSTGNWVLSCSHRYAKKGAYGVSIVIRDTGGFTTTIHSTAQVA